MSRAEPGPSTGSMDPVAKRTARPGRCRPPPDPPRAASYGWRSRCVWGSPARARSLTTTSTPGFFPAAAASRTAAPRARCAETASSPGPRKRCGSPAPPAGRGAWARRGTAAGRAGSTCLSRSSRRCRERARLGMAVGDEGVPQGPVAQRLGGGRVGDAGQRGDQGRARAASRTPCGRRPPAPRGRWPPRRRRRFPPGSGSRTRDTLGAPSMKVPPAAAWICSSVGSRGSAPAPRGAPIRDRGSPAWCRRNFRYESLSATASTEGWAGPRSPPPTGDSAVHVRTQGHRLPPSSRSDLLRCRRSSSVVSGIHQSSGTGCPFSGTPDGARISRKAGQHRGGRGRGPPARAAARAAAFPPESSVPLDADHRIPVQFVEDVRLFPSVREIGHRALLGQRPYPVLIGSGRISPSQAIAEPTTMVGS